MDHLATRRTHSLTALILSVLVAGCDVPPEARQDLPAAQSGPAPDLLPTAAFEAPQERTAERQPDLEEGASDLAARAANLEARAAALGVPVLSPEERARLEATTP